MRRSIRFGLALALTATAFWLAGCTRTANIDLPTPSGPGGGDNNSLPNNNTAPDGSTGDEGGTPTTNSNSGGSTGDTGTPTDNGNGSDGGTGTTTTEVIPSSLSMDLDDYPDVPATQTLQAGGTSPFPGRNELQTRVGAATVRAFQEVVDEVLAVVSEANAGLESITGTTIEGTFVINEREIPYVLELAPYDFDDDGDLEGGPGDGGAVVFRVWVGAEGARQRLMTGRITDFATDESRGAGTIITLPGALFERFGDAVIRVVWDDTDANGHFYEAFTRGLIRRGIEMLRGHHRIDRFIDGDGTITITLRSTVVFGENDYGLTVIRFASRKVRGTPAAVIDAEVEMMDGVDAVNPIDDACVSLMSFDDVLACQDISTEDLAFIDEAAQTDTEVPDTFTETPPSDFPQ